jgi:hypothetical protein
MDVDHGNASAKKSYHQTSTTTKEKHRQKRSITKREAPPKETYHQNRSTTQRETPPEEPPRKNDLEEALKYKGTPHTKHRLSKTLLHSNETAVRLKTQSTTRPQ